LQTSDRIGLISLLTQAKELSEDIDPVVARETVLEAQMVLELPNGSDLDIQMHDDGTNGDLIPNDGVYAGSIKASSSGIYKAQAFFKFATYGKITYLSFRARTSNGTEFVRSTQHLIPVVKYSVAFTGASFSEMTDSERMKIGLIVEPKHVPQDHLFR
jgi:hypothetical protein